jgi:hypothetical protein
VNPDLVTRSVNGAYDFSMPFDLFADEEERGVDIVPGEHFEHARRIAWMRTIVKGERDLAPGWVAPP